MEKAKIINKTQYQNFKGPLLTDSLTETPSENISRNWVMAKVNGGGKTISPSDHWVMNIQTPKEDDSFISLFSKTPKTSKTIAKT